MTDIVKVDQKNKNKLYVVYNKPTLNLDTYTS